MLRSDARRASRPPPKTLKTVLKSDPRADWAYNELIELLYTTRAAAPTPKRSPAPLCESIRSMRRLTTCSARSCRELNDLPSGEWHFRRAIELGGEQARVPREPRAEPHAAGPHRRSPKSCFARADALAPGNSRNARRTGRSFARCAATCCEHWELLERAAAHRSAATRSICCARITSRARARSATRWRLLGRRAGAQRRCAAPARSPARSARTLRRSVAGSRRRQGAAGARSRRAPLRRAGRRNVFRAAGALLRPAEHRSACRRPPCAHDVPQPIFIMGFPRSGTTLIEQVLASHTRRARRRRAAVHDRAAAVRAAAVSRARAVSGEPLAHLDGGQALGRHAVPRLLPRARRAVRTARARQGVLHRQDAVQRDLAAAAAHGVSDSADRARAASSARCLRVHAVEQPDAWLQLRLSDRGHRASSRGRARAGRALRARDGGRCARAALRVVRRRAARARRSVCSTISALPFEAGVPRTSTRTAATRRRRATRRSRRSSTIARSDATGTTLAATCAVRSTQLSARWLSDALRRTESRQSDARSAQNFSRTPA